MSICYRRNQIQTASIQQRHSITAAFEAAIYWASLPIVEAQLSHGVPIDASLPLKVVPLSRCSIAWATLDVCLYLHCDR